MKISEIYQYYKETYQVTTDTRTIQSGVMFFALKGNNFDANTFADEALTKGASYVVIDNKDYYKDDGRHILVTNTLKTLQELAKHHREQLGIPIIALTGSNGKTTTKELLNIVLSQKFKVLATKGNLNNHIGVPLTLLAMNPDTELGIVEMGANHFDEIAFLSEITKPNYGYITNFGKAHLEGFGSIAGVIKAKSELYNYLAKNDGLAFVNQFDPIQVQQAKLQKTHVISNNTKLINYKEFVALEYNNKLINSNLIGDYNFRNIIAAIGIGAYFDVSDKQIKSAIESYIPKNKRSQLIQKGNTKIILDAYNANPTSMQAALEAFDRNSDTSKIVILGDMFELGTSAKKEHQYIASLASTKFDSVFLLGENFYKTKAKNTIKHKNFEAFQNEFNKDFFKNATVLIKGSRGMALERIVDLLT